MAIIQDAFQWIVSPESWDEAERRADVRINSEYMRDKRLNTSQRIEKIAIGYLGEFAFYEWCRSERIPITYLGEEIGNTPDHGDFLSVGQNVIDVKTQEVFFKPQSDWRCEVTDEQINRPVDIYVFSKLYTKGNIRLLYLVGWMSKGEFLEKAVYRVPGTLLKGKPVHYAKRDVTIDQLHGINELIGVLR